MLHFLPRSSPGRLGRSAARMLVVLTAGLALAACASAPAMHEAAPAFAGADSAGQTVTLAEYQGTVLLIDFWATWCGPCRASHPNLQAIEARFRGEPRVRLLAVHIDETGDPAAYFGQNGYEARLIPRGREVARAFDVVGIPLFVLIDQHGNVIHRHAGTLTSQGRDTIIAKIEGALRAG